MGWWRDGVYYPTIDDCKILQYGRIAQPGLEQHHDTVKAVGSNPTATTMEQYAAKSESTASTEGGEIALTVSTIEKSLAILWESFFGLQDKINTVLRTEQEDTVAKDIPRAAATCFHHDSLVKILSNIDQVSEE